MNDRELVYTCHNVSERCPGAMQWGWTVNARTAVNVMNVFVEAGGNFIDTAEVYSFWADDNPGGVSEEIVGCWMNARNNQPEIIFATKARGLTWLQHTQ